MTQSEDAIDSYLIWELCKSRDVQDLILEDSNSLRKTLDRVRRKYNQEDYSIEEKKDFLRELDSNPEYRLKIFESCSWKKESVDLEDLGTSLPHVGDLPPEVISNTLPEVADFVREAEPEEYRSVKYIMSLKELPEVLNEFLPWVVTPGNRLSKRERMENAHGDENWNILDTWGMINDGNHREIAKVLAEDLEQIECYVGHRKD